jgi:hypothetical protein
VVYVKWIDSRGAGGAWTMMKHIDQHSASTCESMGWIIYEDDMVLEIAPHRSDIDAGDEMQVCGEMVIPKVAILERRALD